MKLSGTLPILACFAVVGCNGPTHVEREAVVGEYSYESEDPDDKVTDHEYDHLILRRDGRYQLVQGGSTKPRAIFQGAWTTQDWDNQGTQLLLENSSYPVRIAGGQTRLLVDDDTGIWFAKTK